MNPELRCAIVTAVRRIPPGRVKSYGGVASAAGLPGRARLVGLVLRESSDGENLPWYRVVRANGSLAFAVDSAQFEIQRKKLAAEGVVLKAGKVARDYFGDSDDLDSLLWGPS